jgi:hypothetical protein
MPSKASVKREDPLCEAKTGWVSSVDAAAAVPEPGVANPIRTPKARRALR